MEFNAHKPIYLQICSQLYEQILRGELKADDRILSVRDYGIQLGVNPNTIMRSYETMTAISSPPRPRTSSSSKCARSFSKRSCLNLSKR